MNPILYNKCMDGRTRTKYATAYTLMMLLNNIDQHDASMYVYCTILGEKDVFPSKHK